VRGEKKSVADSRAGGYFHDGRLLTLQDTVEFFNLVSELKLGRDEKAALVAFMQAF
jgi:cytochrome c peroxidase